jgi:hypothetical protein
VSETKTDAIVGFTLIITALSALFLAFVIWTAADGGRKNQRAELGKCVADRTAFATDDKQRLDAYRTCIADLGGIKP